MTRPPALPRARALAAGLALALSAAPAPAGPIAVAGLLADEAFYRLVSCAAPPGGACAETPLRWSTDHAIRVALRRIDPGYLGRRKQRAEAALTRALGELNAADAGFRLARVGPADPAEVVVYFLDLPPGGPIAGTGIDWVDGGAVDEIATLIAVDPDRTRIHRAAIVVAPGLETVAYEAAMLKAMTRAMGLTTEVAGPAYAGLSVLAEGDYGTTRLGRQDLAALRQHYAAPR